MFMILTSSYFEFVDLLSIVNVHPPFLNACFLFETETRERGRGGSGVPDLHAFATA